MNKKKAIKEQISKFRGKGGSGYQSMPTPFQQVGNMLGSVGSGIGSAVRGVVKNNPVSAFVNAYKQVGANNSYLNNAAKQGVNVSNSYMKAHPAPLNTKSK
jgi:hypothetical protein